MIQIPQMCQWNPVMKQNKMWLCVSLHMQVQKYNKTAYAGLLGNMKKSYMQAHIHQKQK